MSDGKAQTQQKLFDAISSATDQAGAYDNPAVKAGVLRDLALAYRLTAGGQQPGGVSLDK